MCAQKKTVGQSGGGENLPQGDLVIVSKSPFNAETPIAEQIGVITPNSRFYARNHFSIPRVDAETWRLSIGGEVKRPSQLTFADLRSFPSRSVLATLECAGNGRTAFQPPIEGQEPFGYGAVSTAEWTGVPLSAVLSWTGLSERASTIVFTGVDQGKVDDNGQTIPFARGLALADALNPDVLLAYAMNGEPLPVEHGFPLRLIVPGWYGVASVKWLTQIEATASPFTGYYQVKRYVLVQPRQGNATPAPVTKERVRSLIVMPSGGQSLPRGQHWVRGLAWSGEAAVTRVEVSGDGGVTWKLAEFASDPERYAWRRWEYLWHATAPGEVTLRSRAVDAAGNTQPAVAEWNQYGYANNAIQVVPLRVV